MLRPPPPLSSSPPAEPPELWRPLALPYLSNLDVTLFVSSRGGVQLASGRLLSHRRSPDKRPRVRVPLADGTYRLLLVSSLVLQAFGSPPPHCHAAALHLDGDLSNLRLANLAWRAGGKLGTPRRRQPRACAPSARLPSPATYVAAAPLPPR